MFGKDNDQSINMDSPSQNMAAGSRLLADAANHDINMMESPVFDSRQVSTEEIFSGSLLPGIDVLISVEGDSSLSFITFSVEIGRKSIESPEDKEARRHRIAEAARVLLACLGEDPAREGLVRTPLRYADALMFLTQGYQQCLTGNRTKMLLRLMCPSLIYIFWLPVQILSGRSC
jgi:hypothetical protein